MTDHEDVNEGLEAFQHRPLKEAVFEYLYDRIIAGKFEPGAWLRQEEVASQLGVSQTPVREAFDLLVSSGLAERVAYRGVRVLKLSMEEMVDAYALRLLLEGSAARAAALNRTSAQLEELKRLVKAMKPLTGLNDMSAQRQLNREFHLLVATASGNLQLARLCEMAANKFPDWMLYEYMFRHPELLQSSLEREYAEHCDIVAAITAQDPDLAVRAVTRHIQNRRIELVTYLDIPQELLDRKARQLNPFLEEH